MNDNTATSPRATVAAAARQVPRAETGYDAARAHRAKPKRETDDNNESERIRASQLAVRARFSAAFARMDDNAE